MAKKDRGDIIGIHGIETTVEKGGARATGTGEMTAGDGMTETTTTTAKTSSGIGGTGKTRAIMGSAATATLTTGLASE